MEAQVEDAEYARRQEEERGDHLTSELEEAWKEAEAQETTAKEASATIAKLRTELEAGRATSTPAMSTEHALTMLSEAQAEVEKLRVEVSSARSKLPICLIMYS